MINMSSYRQILYHIIFRTKGSEKTLNMGYSSELFNYIWGIIQKKNGFLYRINAMEEHVHMLSDLHPSIALADFVRDIKTASSIRLKETGHFPYFKGWADGYAALTYAYWDKEKIINYIKNQQEHHQKETFEEEYLRLLKEHNIEVDMKFFP